MAWPKKVKLFLNLFLYKFIQVLKVQNFSATSGFSVPHLEQLHKSWFWWYGWICLNATHSFCSLEILLFPLSYQNCSGQVKKGQIQSLLLPQVCITEVAGKSQESVCWAVAIVTIAVLQLLPTPGIVNCHIVKAVCLTDLVSQELSGWQLWWQFVTYCGFCLGEWDWSAVRKLAASTVYLGKQMSSKISFLDY